MGGGGPCKLLQLSALELHYLSNAFEMACLGDEGRMRCPLHMILYNCCLASEALTAELCSSGSSRILEPILQLLSEPEVGNIFVSRFCVRQVSD